MRRFVPIHIEGAPVLVPVRLRRPERCFDFEWQVTNAFLQEPEFTGVRVYLRPSDNHPDGQTFLPVGYACLGEEVRPGWVEIYGFRRVRSRSRSPRRPREAPLREGPRAPPQREAPRAPALGEALREATEREAPQREAPRVEEPESRPRPNDRDFDFEAFFENWVPAPGANSGSHGLGHGFAFVPGQNGPPVGFFLPGGFRIGPRPGEAIWSTWNHNGDPLGACPWRIPSRGATIRGQLRGSEYGNLRVGRTARHRQASMWWVV